MLCVNPASLSGGTGPPEPDFPRLPAPTPWLAYPGLYTAHCESSGGADWLQVDATNVAGDQRPVVSQTLGPIGGCISMMSTSRLAPCGFRSPTVGRLLN